MTDNKRTKRGEQLYLSVPDEIRDLIAASAAARGRSISSYLYLLLCNSTNGFTDLSAADRPLIDPNVSNELRSTP